MNKKNIFLGICFFLVIAGIVYFDFNKVERSTQTLQQVYFELVQDDISGESENSNELKKYIDRIMVEDETYIYNKLEEEGNELLPRTNIYKFENKEESLEVSYIINKENGEEENINTISYNHNKEVAKPYAAITYIKQEDNTYGLGTVAYADNLENQKQILESIYKDEKLNEICEVYYKLAKHVENKSAISKEEIENIVGQEVKDLNTHLEGNLHQTYVIEHDNYRFTIGYNVEENKIENVSIETEYTINGTSIYYRNEDELDSKVIITINKNLNEQQQILKDIEKTIID